MSSRVFFITFLLAGFFIWTATTFIIREGGVEVGRYSEEDGQDREVVVDEESPSHLPAVSGAQAGTAEPAGDVWSVSGRVLDVVRLTEVKEGKVIFSAAEQNVEVPLLWNGSFSAKLPRHPGGYKVSFLRADGTRAPAYLGEAGAFRSMEYAARLRLRAITQVQAPVKAHATSLEIGLYPEKLSEREERDFQAVMRASPAAQ